MKLLKFFTPCIIGVLVLILGGCIFIYWLPLPESDEYTPEEGIWYCEDLQVTLSFQGEKQSYIVIDGEKILCGCGNDLGSPDIYLLCQEPGNARYTLGETVFWWEYVSLDKDRYVLKDHYTGEVHIFLRIN